MIQENNAGLDSRPIHIRGEAIKLRNLGWKQLVSIEQILSFLL